MYEKCNPGQRAGLMLGNRLRYAKCLLGNAVAGNRFDVNTFTQDEMDLIKEISENAIARAQKTYNTEAIIIADAKARNRPETESRQYSGK